MSDRIVLAIPPGSGGGWLVLEVCDICAAMVLPTRMVEHKIWHNDLWDQLASIA